MQSGARPVHPIARTEGGLSARTARIGVHEGARRRERRQQYPSLRCARFSRNKALNGQDRLMVKMIFFLGAFTYRGGLGREDGEDWGARRRARREEQTHQMNRQGRGRGGREARGVLGFEREV